MSRIQASLVAQTDALLAVTNDSDNELFIPETIRNNNLDQLNSGMVAYLFTSNGKLIWRSRSSNTYIALPDVKLPYTFTHMLESNLDNRAFFWVGKKIIWEYDSGKEGKYLFLVGERQSILEAAVRSYQREVAIWLSISALALIVILLFALNISLEPLKEARRQIELVSNAKANQVSGNFPRELQPLTSSINQLLQSEKLQRKRYQDALGNLAHSLKTPLAIIKGELQKPSDNIQNEQLAEQVQRIDDIVRYQLNRSVVTAGRLLNRKIKIADEVVKIVSALDKVHADKKLKIEYHTTQDCFFPGELGDLMELIGNLADNACKWANSRVIIRAYEKSNKLYLQVSDDGPGIPIEKRQLILNRGKRLDQQAEGQGLGLSIVTDIIQSYRGELVIDQSKLGGSRFIAIFPV
jgi:two-component system sensor histidine kinase PhoQ